MSAVRSWVARPLAPSIHRAVAAARAPGQRALRKHSSRGFRSSTSTTATVRDTAVSSEGALRNGAGNSWKATSAKALASFPELLPRLVRPDFSLDEEVLQRLLGSLESEQDYDALIEVYHTLQSANISLSSRGVLLLLQAADRFRDFDFALELLRHQLQLTSFTFARPLVRAVVGLAGDIHELAAVHGLLVKRQWDINEAGGAAQDGAAAVKSLPSSTTGEGVVYDALKDLAAAVQPQSASVGTGPSLEHSEYARGRPGPTDWLDMAKMAADVGNIPLSQQAVKHLVQAEGRWSDALDVLLGEGGALRSHPAHVHGNGIITASRVCPCHTQGETPARHCSLAASMEAAVGLSPTQEQQLASFRRQSTRASTASTGVKAGSRILHGHPLMPEVCAECRMALPRPRPASSETATGEAPSDTGTATSLRSAMRRKWQKDKAAKEERSLLEHEIDLVLPVLEAFGAHMRGNWEGGVTPRLKPPATSSRAINTLYKFLLNSHAAYPLPASTHFSSLLCALTGRQEPPKCAAAVEYPKAISAQLLVACYLHPITRSALAEVWTATWPDMAEAWAAEGSTAMALLSPDIASQFSVALAAAGEGSEAAEGGGEGGGPASLAASMHNSAWSVLAWEAAGRGWVSDIELLTALHPSILQWNGSSDAISRLTRVLRLGQKVPPPPVNVAWDQCTQQGLKQSDPWQFGNSKNKVCVVVPSQQPSVVWQQGEGVVPAASSLPPMYMVVSSGSGTERHMPLWTSGPKWAKVDLPWPSTYLVDRSLTAAESDARGLWSLLTKPAEWLKRWARGRGNEASKHRERESILQMVPAAVTTQYWGHGRMAGVPSLFKRRELQGQQSETDVAMAATAIPTGAGGTPFASTPTSMASGYFHGTLPGPGTVAASMMRSKGLDRSSFSQFMGFMDARKQPELMACTESSLLSADLDATGVPGSAWSSLQSGAMPLQVAAPQWKEAMDAPATLWGSVGSALEGERGRLQWGHIGREASATLSSVLLSRMSRGALPPSFASLIHGLDSSMREEWERNVLTAALLSAASSRSATENQYLLQLFAALQNSGLAPRDVASRAALRAAMKAGDHAYLFHACDQCSSAEDGKYIKELLECVINAGEGRAEAPRHRTIGRGPYQLEDAGDFVDVLRGQTRWHCAVAFPDLFPTSFLARIRRGESSWDGVVADGVVMPPAKSLAGISLHSSSLTRGAELWQPLSTSAPAEANSTGVQSNTRELVLDAVAKALPSLFRLAGRDKQDAVFLNAESASTGIAWALDGNRPALACRLYWSTRLAAIHGKQHTGDDSHVGLEQVNRIISGCARSGAIADGLAVFWDYFGRRPNLGSAGLTEELMTSLLDMYSQAVAVAVLREQEEEYRAKKVSSGSHYTSNSLEDYRQQFFPVFEGHRAADPLHRMIGDASTSHGELLQVRDDLRKDTSLSRVLADWACSGLPLPSTTLSTTLHSTAKDERLELSASLQPGKTHRAFLRPDDVHFPLPGDLTSSGDMAADVVDVMRLWDTCNGARTPAIYEALIRFSAAGRSPRAALQCLSEMREAGIPVSENALRWTVVACTSVVHKKRSGRSRDKVLSEDEVTEHLETACTLVMNMLKAWHARTSQGAEVPSYHAPREALRQGASELFAHDLVEALGRQPQQEDLLQCFTRSSYWFTPPMEGKSLPFPEIAALSDAELHAIQAALRATRRTGRTDLMGSIINALIRSSSSSLPQHIASSHAAFKAAAQGPLQEALE